MKKIFAILLVLAVAFTAFAGGSSEAPAAAPAAKAADVAVAMVTDYGDITDQSFNQTTYEACKAFAEANGLKFKYYKPAGDNTADRVAMIEQAIGEGFNVIVMPGYAFAGAIAEAAPQYKDVKFVIQNSTNVTGSYYLEASKSADGVYYITGSTDKEADATRFVPNDEGKLIVYGLEEDTYIITDVETAAGYTLLRDSISVEVTTAYTPGDKCGALTATASVDGNLVTMEKAGNSDNALVPLTVLNTKGFDLPKAGGPGTLATTICGVLIVCGMGALAIVTRKRKHG